MNAIGLSSKRFKSIRFTEKGESMKYFLFALLLPVLNFADTIEIDNPYFYDAKSYAQNRIQKLEFIRLNEIDNNSFNFEYDSNFNYGYIVGAQSAYRDMLNILK